jgi:hypothetical protein
MSKAIDLTKLSVSQLNTMRENARRKGRNDIVEQCTRELEFLAAMDSAAGEYVVGIHLKCEQGTNVEDQPDGTFWTGNWVIDEAHAVLAPRVGAYLALHEQKTRPSYMQGKIIDWRRSNREPPAKIQTGVAFLVKSTSQPYSWVGESTGEKGYAWFRKSEEGSRRRGHLSWSAGDIEHH